MASSLVSELEHMSNALEKEEITLADISLPTIAERVAKHVGVSQRWRHLHFIVPSALKNVGFIPLTSNSALAARTVRDSRPEINNNFSAVRHATVFEGVKTATTSGQSIQKIVSAPILCDGKVVGVMQISRKGTSASNAGPDFTADDLGKVLAICRPLGKIVMRLAGE
jgi:hypothetical protein